MECSDEDLRSACKASAVTIQRFQVRSVKDSVLLCFLNLANLENSYIIMRRPIFALQAFSQCILIASIYRTWSTIYLEDKVFMREAAIRSDPSFHDTPHQLRSETI
jgi:hypothetical protein